MKIVNSPVARPDLGRINWGSCCKASELAINKHIARKKERAMLKRHIGRDISNELAQMDEDVQQLRLERDMTYQGLMQRIMVDEIHTRRSRSSKAQAMARTRVAFLVFFDSNATTPTLLASCAPAFVKRSKQRRPSRQLAQ